MKMKILVVEDNEQSLSLFTRLLEKNGYQVIQARDGYEGLAAAEQARPDLILLDILLPGIDGYTVAQTLRSSPKFADIPILAVTALPLLGNRERALGVGCNDYLEKPVDPNDLMAKINQHLMLP